MTRMSLQESFYGDPDIKQPHRAFIPKSRKLPPPHIRRMYPLRYHPIQAAGWQSTARFNLIPAGRRSGKTEIFGKRKIVMKAIIGSAYGDGRYFAGAPTRDQAKRIFWKDLKLMTPKHLQARLPSESELIIFLINGSEIHVLGMDKPERIEGPPWDHGCLDEYGNMKRDTWEEHVRPALSDRQGSCDFIGVPEGRNHYYDLWKRAISDDEDPNWQGFHWVSADILPQSEIDQAKRDMDELTYLQEYEGSFVMFAGMAYYNWQEKVNEQPWSKYYDKKNDLIIMFDFNVNPGVAIIAQEMKKYPKGQIPVVGKTTTACIGEVYIPRNSNTIRVSDKIVADWYEHEGNVFCYGDATGGAGGSAKIAGSDWDLVKKILWPIFKERLFIEVPPANPRERVRINAVNSRLLNVLGETYLVVDPVECPNTVKDFEGTRILEGGTGEIDKKRDPMLSHLTDAIGYYVNRVYPVRKYISSGQKYWK